MYGGGPQPRYIFRGRRGLFLRPPHVRDFVKEGYPGVVMVAVLCTSSCAP